MKILTKIVAGICVLSFASAAMAQTVGSDSKKKVDTKGLISFPAAGLKWETLEGTGGVKYANVRGSLTAGGPYEAFVIFPAGKDNPYHVHTQNLPTVVLKGTFYAVINGKRTEYPAGSFYDLPGKMPHFSGCTKAEDCLLFQYQADHFDLVPTEKK